MNTERRKRNSRNPFIRYWSCWSRLPTCFMLPLWKLVVIILKIMNTFWSATWSPLIPPSADPDWTPFKTASKVDSMLFKIGTMLAGLAALWSICNWRVTLVRAACAPAFVRCAIVYMNERYKYIYWTFCTSLSLLLSKKEILPCKSSTILWTVAKTLLTSAAFALGTVFSIFWKRLTNVWIVARTEFWPPLRNSPGSWDSSLTRCVWSYEDIDR